LKSTWCAALPEELENAPTRTGDREADNEGLLFIGDRGKILCRFNGAHPRLIPEQNGQLPAAENASALARERTRMAGCLQRRKTKPGGNFEFSGVVTETLLRGNVAIRSGEKLTWDRASMKVTNSDEAQKFVRPDRRRGWEL
jgi:hypothetical protein